MARYYVLKRKSSILYSKGTFEYYSDVVRNIVVLLIF